ncbi:hypothetical protein Cgig2_002966 [Carnegiea gigantea]|uniref:Uncharacterized protein n=1 Tax=Carnegiea gigantea TaxID=171969 RepID=A0A9Q1GJU0_9CARY|nr:hypothetical protein Cgig2_002966 [Carnegiea gigantea]
MVISHGYETSTSGLRMLGVEEYSQLDHEGVPGSERGTAFFWGMPTTTRPSIKAKRLGNCGWRPSTWGPANPSGMSSLDEQDDDIIYKYNKRMLGRSRRVYLQKMKIQNRNGGSAFLSRKRLSLGGASLKLEASTGPLEDARSAGGFTGRKVRAPLSLYSTFSNQNSKGPQCNCCRAHISVVHNHGIEDRLHHLGNVGVLSVPCSHGKVETRTEYEVILREGPQTLGQGLPQGPSKGFLNEKDAGDTLEDLKCLAEVKTNPEVNPEVGIFIKRNIGPQEKLQPTMRCSRPE